MTSRMTSSRDSKLKMAVCERTRESALGIGGELRLELTIVKVDRVPCRTSVRVPSQKRQKRKGRQRVRFPLVTRIASEVLDERAEKRRTVETGSRQHRPLSTASSEGMRPFSTARKSAQTLVAFPFPMSWPSVLIRAYTHTDDMLLQTIRSRRTDSSRRSKPGRRSSLGRRRLSRCCRIVHRPAQSRQSCSSHRTSGHARYRAAIHRNRSRIRRRLGTDSR
jgi:hypothetical protein